MSEADLYLLELRLIKSELNEAELLKSVAALIQAVRTRNELMERAVEVLDPNQEDLACDMREVLNGWK